MKKWILLVIWIIIPVICLSQSGYPKEIILKGDSLVAFTYGQVKEINKALVELEQVELVFAVTDSLLHSCNDLVYKGNVTIINLKEQLSLYQDNEKYYDTIKLQLEKDLEKERKKRNKAGIWGTIGGFIGGAVISGVIVSFIVK